MARLSSLHNKFMSDHDFLESYKNFNTFQMQTLIKRHTWNNTTEISILWDIENCGIRKNELAREVVLKLRKFLSEKGRIKDFICFCNASHQKPTTRRELYECGVDVKDIPTGKADASDLALMVYITKIVFDHPPPHTVALISGDQDFCLMLRVLMEFGYQVILFHTGSARQDLILSAHISLEWDKFKSKQFKPQSLPSSTHLNTNSSNNPILIVDDDDCRTPTRNKGLRQQHPPTDSGGDRRGEVVLYFGSDSKDGGVGGNGKVIIGPFGLLQEINEITIEFWLFIERSHGMLLSKERTCTMWIKDQCLFFSLFSSSSSSVLFGHKIPTKIPLQKWTHICITYHGTKKLVVGYFNGKPKFANSSFSGTLHMSDYPITIGASFEVRSFVGAIRDLRIWSCSLTHEEVNYSMNCESIKPTSHLIGWWPLTKESKDNGASSSTNSDENTITGDYGPNGLGGVIDGPLLLLWTECTN